jgi:hypothetical protein
MFSSNLGRFAAAAVVGLIAASAVLGIAIALDGAFFAPPERIAVVPCYFTAPDPLATEGAEPGVPQTATGCLPAPEDDNGIAGFFARLMGQAPAGAQPQLLQPPPENGTSR